MKIIFLVLMMCGFNGLAQAPLHTNSKGISDYFYVQNKSTEVQKIQNDVNKGCYQGLKETQDLIIKSEWDYLVDESIKIVKNNFSKAFDENPKIAENFQKDIENLKTNQKCQTTKNDCRSNLMATLFYYYRNLRPNCHELVSAQDLKNMSKNDLKKFERGVAAIQYRCGDEEENRKKAILSRAISNGQLDNRSDYTKLLVDRLNSVTKNLINLTLKSDGKTLICNKPKDVANDYEELSVNEVYGELVKQLDPTATLTYEVVETPKKKEPLLEKTPCEKIESVSSFVQVNFPEGSSTLSGKDLVPLINKIKLLAENEKMEVNKITIEATASKTPKYFLKKGSTKKEEKIIFEKNKDFNIGLAKDRATFAQGEINKLKTGRIQSAVIETNVLENPVRGPEFISLANKEALEKESCQTESCKSKYLEKVRKIYDSYKGFKSEAQISSAEELANNPNFKNLYEVTYKPFQGFNVTLTGKSKKDCSDSNESTSNTSDKKNSTPATSVLPSSVYKAAGQKR